MVLQVVQSGLCIGCGACVSACPEGMIVLERLWTGIWQARAVEGCCSACGRCEKVCPFSPTCPDEDELGRELFAEESTVEDEVLGYVRSSYVFRHPDENLRLRSASGGAVTWFLERCLREGVVDRVAAVAASSGDFEYVGCDSVQQVRRCSGSAYRALRVDTVLSEIRESEMKWAVVAVPCVAKAIRSLCQLDARLQRSIRVLVGLTCGQTKTNAFSEWVAWHRNLPVDQVSRFRVKEPQRPADDFAVEFEGGSRVHWREEVAPSWHARLFTPPACGVCDDLFAETADVTCMDAWLPEFTSDWRGTSLVLVRSTLVDEVIAGAERAGEAEEAIERCCLSRLRSSQGGPERDKRVGLAYRLELRGRRGVYTPSKRVLPGLTGSSLERLAWRVAERNAEVTFRMDESSRFQLYRWARKRTRIFSAIRRVDWSLRRLDSRLKGGIRRIARRNGVR